MKTTIACLTAILLNSPSPSQGRVPTRSQTPAPVARTTDVRIEATIRDGVATTKIIQTLHNPTRRPIESDWVLPLPPGAIADEFSMTMGGKMVAGEVVSADRARTIYEDIVRRRRDPGLLEYYGHGCLRARVFPIPAGGDMRVVVQYRQVLPATGNLSEWRFPLRAIAGVDGATITLDANVQSSRPLKSVYSPLGGIDVVRKNDHQARASLELERGAIPQTDLQLFLSTETRSFGVDLLTHRIDRNGYFLAIVTPQHDWPEPKNVSRVVQFVIDTSGSMKGQKIVQARDALRYFVQSLRPTDYFNVVPFSTEARPFFDAPLPADSRSVERALEKIAAIEANGGTNIESGMQAALTADLPKVRDGHELVPITVFLTDGQPTVGLTEPDQLLKRIAEQNLHGERIFVFGVGNSVNTRLLDRIAAASRGDRDYVREDENIEVKTSALFTKLSNPVMTDLEFVADGVEWFEQSPKDLPDMFKGGRLLVFGRYRGDGTRALRLRGKVQGERREYVFEADFRGDKPGYEFVPGLWAERRIAMLLDAIRMHGKSAELVDEVKRLGREFGLVTPYTSHLIVEEGQRLAQARGALDSRGRFLRGDDDSVRVIRELKRAGNGRADFDGAELRGKIADSRSEADRSREALEGLADAPTAGAEAVRRSQQLDSLSKKHDAFAISGNAAAEPAAQLLSHRVDGRTFHLVGGVWVDQSYTEAMHGKERRITTFSDDYFELLRSNSDIAKALAFSQRMVLVLRDGTAVELVSR